MLVGPNAVLSLKPRLRGTFMTHSYDFYKNDTRVEFPTVNGHESLRSYISALDMCYKHLRERLETTEGETNGHQAESGPSDLLDRFDYMAFHTPNCKLVSKSYGRLMYNDVLHSTDESIRVVIPSELIQLSYEESLKSKELEKLFVTLSKDRFKARVEPCIAAPTLCGNMYTASLYCSLISLISNINPEEAKGKTIGMFSYGSGIASTLFALKVTGDVSGMVRKIDLMNRLSRRRIATPEEYEKACALRLKAYGSKGFEPAGDVAALATGTCYLESVDDTYRRRYAIKD